VAVLDGGELEAGDDTSRFGDVVVLNRGFEVLAEGLGLAELAAEPA
jgi:hypothetical protein